MTDREAALDEFYALLGELERHRPRARLAACHGRMDWPQRGVYFFFEDGELRADGVSERVVRVGTHGLRPSKSTVWGRLAQHRGNVSGAKPGGGNHRGSIFRLHVGSALLNRDQWPTEVAATWSVGSSAPPTVRERELPLERAVSAHIGAMSFLVLGVDDDPSPASDRGVIESGSIALLSNFGRQPVDPPSVDWLGRNAGRRQVVKSGLWNINHVTQPADAAFLYVMARHLGV